MPLFTFLSGLLGRVGTWPATSHFPGMRAPTSPTHKKWAQCSILQNAWFSLFFPYIYPSKSFKNVWFSLILLTFIPQNLSKMFDFVVFFCLHLSLPGDRGTCRPGGAQSAASALEPRPSVHARSEPARRVLWWIAAVARQETVAFEAGIN